MIPTELLAVAREALDDRERLSAVVLAAITSALPELAAEPAMAELLGTTVADTLTAGLTVIGTGTPIGSARAPVAALDLARRLAQRQIGLATMLRAYRLGQAAFQQDLITRAAERARTAAEVAAVARELSSATFGFVDVVTEEVVAAYQTEREGWLQRRNAARLANVEAVLAGADRDLGYPMRGVHLGAVVWCGPDGDQTGLERQVAAAALALGCARAPLVVAPDGTTLWVWFPDPGRPEALEQAIDDGTYLAVGLPATGVDGFRATHRQARDGRIVASAARPADRARVTTPQALGPLALLAVDPAGLRHWVRAALGGLAADDELAARLRETLGAYLSAGGSRAAAAAELHLHRNTIEYRLRQAEELRGRPISDERLSLEVALLATRVLGATVLS